MSGRVITIGETTAALAAWELMAKHGIRHLPVVDIDRRLIGIVSDRDLRQAILQQSLQQAGVRPDLRMLRVSEVMTRGVLTVHPDVGIRQAAEVMHRRGLGALPVAREGRVVGLLTGTDVIRALTAWAPTRPRAGPRRSAAR